MGYECGPEMLHTVARVLAGDAAAVASRCAAPCSIQIRVWIGNIRISGPRQGVEEWCRVATRNARQCGAAPGESNWLSKKCGFIGAPFDHETGTAFLSQKTIIKLREAPPLEGLTVAEMKCLASRIMRAARVRGGALFVCYFSLKAVGRRLSKLNGGLFQLNDSAGLPGHAVRQGNRWLSALLENKPVAPRRHRHTSAALATDASMCGWDAIPFKDGGCVCGGWRVGLRATLHLTGRGAWRAPEAQFFCRSDAEKSAHLHWEHNANKYNKERQRTF
uniref:Uncharacterized protein n=1 Tax=Trypanosoma vivax (strain Y486) TaxID=1055687 RepID=G0UCM5_TRYVY|nr:hypothetical protein TVY486_1110690 [Trypanosoma vivax Y486]